MQANTNDILIMIGSGIQKEFPIQESDLWKCQLHYNELERKITMLPDYLNKRCIPMCCILTQYTEKIHKILH